VHLSRLTKSPAAESFPNSPFPPAAGASSTTARDAPQGSTDPEEVDISQHFFTPGNDVGRQFQRQLQQMMVGNSSPGSITNNAQDSPFATADLSFLQDQQRQQRPQPQQQGQAGVGMGTGMGMGLGDGGEDPFSRILQQMMAGGGGPGGGGGGGGTNGLPPGLAAMFGGASAQAQQAPSQTDQYGYMWKIVHAVFALALGIYITSVTAFSGSRLARTTSGFVDSSGNGAVDVGVRFFWVFATAELVLQSSRFFVERGRVGRSGLLGTVAGFLPEPYQGYLGLVGRYSGIWNTVVQDAMVVIFVLGCVAWWKEVVR